jgi:predicted phage-related endonuclease
VRSGSEIHRIERDEEVISRLVVLEARFWDHVINDIEPPADGSGRRPEACGACIRAKTRLSISARTELVETFSNLVSLNEAVAEQEQQAELLKQTLQQAMGDHPLPGLAHWER